MSDPAVPVRTAPAVDVDVLAAAVRACPAVADLAAGDPGSAATYLPGRRIPGLAVDADRVRIQVRSRWAVPIAELAHQIRSATRPLVGDRAIEIVVADIDDPSGEPASDVAVPEPSTFVPPVAEALRPERPDPPADAPVLVTEEARR